MAQERINEGGIELKNSCDIILDLIPLVKDGVASRESEKLVFDHIKTCPNCKKEYETMNKMIVSQENLPTAEVIVKKIKRRMFAVQIAILIAGTLFGVALTNTMGMFYNVVIMPLLGALSFIALKKKWFIGVLGISLISFLYEFVMESILEGFTMGWVIGSFYLSAIYTAFVMLGVVIGVLMHFAIKGRWS